MITAASHRDSGRRAADDVAQGGIHTLSTRQRPSPEAREVDASRRDGPEAGRTSARNVLVQVSVGVRYEFPALKLSDPARARTSAAAPYSVSSPRASVRESRTGRTRTYPFSDAAIPDLYVVFS